MEADKLAVQHVVSGFVSFIISFWAKSDSDHERFI